MKKSMIKSALLATLFAVGTMSVFTACKDDDKDEVKDTVVFGTPVFAATTLKVGIDVVDGKITIPYQKALGSEEYTVKVAVSGTGAAGITVADKSVKLTSGSGNIELAVTGKPTTEGAVTFTISGIIKLSTTAVAATVGIPTLAWAEGNLVADAAKGGCKIGTPTDGGLYFQFGSLVGWSGGANGDGTGKPIDGSALAMTVKPASCTVTGWNASWTGDPTKEDAVKGTGDPCKYYLKGTWRLPTKDEYMALLKDNGYPSTGPWKWNNTSKSAEHKDGMKFSASGFRFILDGVLKNAGSVGYFWSASPDDDNDSFGFYFASAIMVPSINDGRGYGLAVRCVQLK